jgi:hypothetical protein
MATGFSGGRCRRTTDHDQATGNQQMTTKKKTSNELKQIKI